MDFQGTSENKISDGAATTKYEDLSAYHQGKVVLVTNSSVTGA